MQMLIYHTIQTQVNCQLNARLPYALGFAGIECMLTSAFGFGKGLRTAKHIGWSSLLIELEVWENQRQC